MNRTSPRSRAVHTSSAVSLNPSHMCVSGYWLLVFPCHVCLLLAVLPETILLEQRHNMRTFVLCKKRLECSGTVQCSVSYENFQRD